MVTSRFSSNPAKLRDRPAWDESLVSRLKSSLERQLTGHGRLPVPAEDLVSEVLLRLLAHDPREIQSPLAYARTVLRNLVRDKIRELERAGRLLETLADRGDSREPPGEEPRRLEDGELIRSLLERTALSPLQSEVIRMRYFQGMKIAEVARVLGVNPGTVYRHHDRAIDKLARCAARMEGDK